MQMIFRRELPSALIRLFRYGSEFFCPFMQHPKPLRICRCLAKYNALYSIVLYCNSMWNWELSKEHQHERTILSGIYVRGVPAIYWPVLSKLASADRERARSFMKLGPLATISSFSFLMLCPTYTVNNRFEVFFWALQPSQKKASVFSRPRGTLRYEEPRGSLAGQLPITRWMRHRPQNLALSDR